MPPLPQSQRGMPVPLKQPVLQDGDEYTLNRWAKTPLAFSQSLTQTWQTSAHTRKRKKGPEDLFPPEQHGLTDDQTIHSPGVTESNDTVKLSTKRRSEHPPNSDTHDAVVLFACPFFQRSKLAYCQTGSCARAYASFQRLKEHLKRHHYSEQQCVRCWKKFKTLKDYQNHSKTLDLDYACGVNSQRPEGMDDAQYSKTVRYSRIADTDEEKWQNMFQILFPGEAALSPYWQDGGHSRTRSSAVNTNSRIVQHGVDQSGEHILSETPQCSDPSSLQPQMGLQPLLYAIDDSYDMQQSANPEFLGTAWNSVPALPTFLG